MAKEVLAIIPARGGSKGVPRKNVRSVAGKPLIAYSIQTALESKLISRVIVSTDDLEIAEVAKKYGAEVPFIRPAEFARDESLDLEVFQHALEWLKKNEGYIPEAVVHLRPTCPIRRLDIVDQAIETFLAHPEADSLRGIGHPHQTPYKMWKMVNGYLEPLLSVPGMIEHYNMPRQKLPEVFWQNGYIDITRPKTVIEMGMMNGKKILPLVIEDEWVDIDYEESIADAEKLIHHRQENGLNPVAPRPKRHSS